MFIELVDSLRCLTPHEETWLVAAVTLMDGRHIIEGTLGCPVCHREYAIRDGVAWFTASTPDAAPPDLSTIDTTSDDDTVMRAAALLGLSDPGGIVVLGGSWTAVADMVAERGAAHVVVLNKRATDASAQEVSSIVVDEGLPFARGGLRAVGLDGGVANPALLASAAEALRSRGRLVAPAASPAPPTVRVLARDEAEWVAERDVVASPPVLLRSSRGLSIE